MSYVAQYATSGRAGCRWCRGSISKGELRLATMVQSKHHNGFDPHWFHVPCFFLKHGFVDKDTHFDGIHSLSNSDQELITKYLVGEIAPPKTKETTQQKSGLDGLVNSGEFLTEYAKSNQSHCISCEGRIRKGEIRISQKDYTSQRALMIPTGCMDRWHHVDCFVTNRESLEFFKSAHSLPGISWLKESDRNILVQKLPRIDGSYFNNNNKKRQREDVDEGMVGQASQSQTPAKAMTMAVAVAQTMTPEESAALEAQEEQERMILGFKADLSIHLDDAEKLTQLLLYNNQDIPIGAEKMIDRLADLMTFGALARCQTCKGQFVFKKGEGYKCLGYISELSKCTKLLKEPPRVPFAIPDDMKANPALVNYVYTPRNRVIVPEVEASENEPPRKLPRIDRLPLHNYKFLISDEIDPPTTTAIREKVEAYGGQIISKLTKNINAIFSTNDEILKLTKRIEYAEKFKIPVISSSFIHDISEVDFDIQVTIRKHLISNWIWIPNKNTSSFNRFSDSELQSQSQSFSSPLPLRCFSSTMNMNAMR